MHALNFVCELGVITVSIINLFSERQHPDYGSDMHLEQFMVMLVSIATTLIAFLLTMIGAGSSLAGLKVVAAGVREAGARRRSARQSAVGNCVVPIANPLVSELELLEGIAACSCTVTGACVGRTIGGCVRRLQLLKTTSLCRTASRNLESTSMQGIDQAGVQNSKPSRKLSLKAIQYTRCAIWDF